MNNKKIRMLLISSILVMVLGPLAGVFMALSSVISTTLNLSFNADFLSVLEVSSDNLKKLRILNPKNEHGYFLQFKKVEELKHIYSEPELVKQKISSSIYVYFIFGTSIAIFLSVVISLFLSHAIARSYARIFNDLSREKEKVNFLEGISAWQDLAKMLAHEIKNPLTPIEILVSSLASTYESSKANEFPARLKNIENMVYEELNHLKIIVNRFSDFSNMPVVQPAKVDLSKSLKKLISAMPMILENEVFNIHYTPDEKKYMVMIDINMFRQVLINIVRNGIESNPEKMIDFEVYQYKQKGKVKIVLTNSGKEIPVSLSKKIFDPYYSSKKGRSNMGLGLAIVKKIIMEHDGEIHYKEIDAWPAFVITLNECQ